jgi:hypothetical protein
MVSDSIAGNSLRHCLPGMAYHRRKDEFRTPTFASEGA